MIKENQTQYKKTTIKIWKRGVAKWFSKILTKLLQNACREACSLKQLQAKSLSF